MSKYDVTLTMTSGVYHCVVTKTGHPPMCKRCDLVIEIGQPYFRRHTARTKSNARHLPCARMSNFVD